MSFTNFQGGLTSLGIPQVGYGASMPGRTGAIYFVDSTRPGGEGFDPMNALSTIQAALDKCASGAGDTIFVFPGEYAENLVVTKDNVSIIGCVNGGWNRPDIVVDSGVALTVQAQGFCAYHLRFSSGDADVVRQNGNGFIYADCVFDGDGQAGAECLLRLVGLAEDDSYTASEGLIVGNLFRGSGALGLVIQHAANPSGVGCSDNQIIGNTFVGNTGADLASATNTTGGGAGIFLNTTIQGNKFLTGSKAPYADMDQGAAGDLDANSALICGNFFADAVLTAAQFDIGSQPLVFFTGNYDATGLVDGSAFNS